MDIDDTEKREGLRIAYDAAREQYSRALRKWGSWSAQCQDAWRNLVLARAAFDGPDCVFCREATANLPPASK